MKVAAQFLLILAALGCVTARGDDVPDDGALERARRRVEQLTADDYEALRVGNKTRIALARDLRDYATQPDIDPAAKYLLLRAAFRQYVQSAEVSEISNAYTRLRRKYGPEYAISIARFSKTHLQHLVSVRKDGAKELLAALSEESRRVRTVESLRAQMAEHAEAGEMRIRLAVAYIALGDWERALQEIETYGGTAAEIVRFERDYPRTGVTRRTSADVAEFWWNIAENSNAESCADTALRRHAAVWYRRAVANGVLRGAERDVAEARAAEGGGDAEDAP